MGKLMRLSIAVFFVFFPAAMQRNSVIMGGGGIMELGRRGGVSVSSRDLDGAGNDAVIIFGMKRWPRGYR